MNLTQREIAKIIKTGGEVHIGRYPARPNHPGSPAWVEVTIYATRNGRDFKRGMMRVIDQETIDEIVNPGKDVLGELIAACYENTTREDPGLTTGGPNGEDATRDPDHRAERPGQEPRGAAQNG